MLLTDSVMWHLNCKFPIVKNAPQLIAVKIAVYLKHVRVSEYVLNHTDHKNKVNVRLEFKEAQGDFILVGEGEGIN